MFNGTGPLLDNVENRKFKLNYDKRIVEIAEWFKTSTDNEQQVSGKEKLDLLGKLISSASVSDSLEEYLSEQTDSIFHYVGINQFVIDYYTANPNSEWKLKAVLQVGFPFAFTDPKCNSEVSKFYSGIERIYLEDKKWSIFVFTKEQPTKVTLGFDDRNTYSNLWYQKRKNSGFLPDKIEELPDSYTGGPFLFWDCDNDDQDIVISNFLKTWEIPSFTNAEHKAVNYSFAEVPFECFRIDYLDYLSRYKKSVIDLFGYPDKDEKIKRLKDIVEFVYAPNKKRIYSLNSNSKQNVLIQNFCFQNQHIKPEVRIGPQDYFYEEYELHSYDKRISPYYLYCLLTSEFVTDYYSERYSGDEYESSSLPLEDCIYIEMAAEKMQNRKYAEIYEREINPRLKAHEMISSKTFSNTNAKGSIEKYLVEIKNNIDSGSYYSATIVMGSVLEAFLIDWLSELDGKNYFEEDYLVTDKRHKYQRRADLMDYIDIIQKRRPDWIDGAKKATEIRKKRNLVHAKLYIAEGEITQEICYEMLRNLEVIINNRWPKQ